MPERGAAKMARGALWSGTLTFGLVSIPVALFPGNRSRRTSLRMLAPDGTPLQRRYYCPAEDRPISRDEIVRGYEYESGHYVVVTDEELAALEPKKSREIDLRLFVPREQVDPIYFDRPYYLAPTGDSAKAYRLLAETMEKTARAGIATFVMRSREYLVAILAEDGLLRAQTMRFADEVRRPQDVGLSEPQQPADSVVDAIGREIRAAAADRLDPKELTDEYQDRVLQLIERKKAAGEGILYTEEVEESEEGGEVIDLMEVLKRSIAGGKDAAGESGREMRSDLRNESKETLYARAKALDIPGRSAMGKEELAAAIRKSKKPVKGKRSGGMQK